MLCARIGAAILLEDESFFRVIGDFHVCRIEACEYKAIERVEDEASEGKPEYG